jgi:hypothetical protein
MQENLIKNYVKLDSPSKEELISVNIILEIQMSEDKTVLESIKMNFNKNINISDMLKEIIPNFNDSLENNKKKIYLNPDSNEYQLCECFEVMEGGMRTYTNGNILEKRTKLMKVSSRNFKLLYSPKDILLNFQKKKNICEGCLII